MKKYFKKFSVMFVMLLAVIGFGMISNGTVANAAEDNYIPKKDYSQNLVANYKFNETSGTTCADSKGKYNGTYSGTTSVTDISQGSSNTYRTFNGASDYANINYNVIPIGKKTIKLKMKTTQTSLGTILTNTNKTNGFDNTQFTIRNNSNGQINTIIQNGNSVLANLTSNKSVNNGMWHTIVVTYDNSILKIYIDDMTTPDCSTTASGSETSYNSILTFGYFFPESGFYRYYQGALDDVEIYNDVVEYEDESITLNKSSLDLTEGTSQQLTATTTAGAQVTWTSDNTGVATVDSTGKVTGVKEGTCTITATTVDGLTATCTVTVAKKAEQESISLNKSTTNLTTGSSETLIATTTPSAVNVKWSSSDTSVATVDSSGKVTAIGAGITTITATTTDRSNLSASCTVNVTKETNPNPEPTGSDNIVNTAYAKGDNTNNASGGVSIIFNGDPDTTLSVVKTGDVKSVWVGDNFTYTIVVTNTGSKTAKAVIINDSAPNHIQFTPSGITTTQGTVDSSSTSKNIIVNVGYIPPSGIVTITIPATVIK